MSSRVELFSSMIICEKKIIIIPLLCNTSTKWSSRRDGDTIRAVVLASAVNQDGRTPGISLPSSEAQQKLIRSAYQQAGVDPRETGYVEAHGTGVSLLLDVCMCISNNAHPIHSLNLTRVINRRVYKGVDLTYFVHVD